MRLLFILQFVLVAVLLLAHLYFSYYELYWHYLWLDIPMHFLGGAWAGLFSLWTLQLFRGRTPLLGVIVGIIAISIGWELLELATGFRREANFAFDTALDLLMDMIGGLTMFALVRSFLPPARDTIVPHETQSDSS